MPVSTPTQPKRRRPVSTYAALMIAHRGINVYRVADAGWRWGWNEYPGRRIGVGIVTGRVCWTINWRRA